jgi:hypothetical protein
MKSIRSSVNISGSRYLLVILTTTYRVIACTLKWLKKKVKSVKFYNILRFKFYLNLSNKMK